MAGRVILIAFTCAISGLLITALTSKVTLSPVQKGIDLYSWSSDDSRAEISRLADTDARSMWKSLSIGQDQNELKHRNDRQAVSERSMGKEKPYDPTLMISVESLTREHKRREEMVFVDVRGDKAFEQCHITGSINVPLHAVKTKSFLRTTALILLDEGFPSAYFEEQCRQLKASGFMIWMLEGGLNAWRESGAPLEGEQLARNNLNRLAPQRLFEERDSDRWMAVDARRSKKTNEALPFSKVISLDEPDDAEKSRVTLVKYLKDSKKRSPLYFVVFNEDGMHYEKAEMIIRKAGIKNAFYLRNGLEGYSAFLGQRAAILRKTDHSGRTVRQCASCP